MDQWFGRMGSRVVVNADMRIIWLCIEVCGCKWFGLDSGVLVQELHPLNALTVIL